MPFNMEQMFVNGDVWSEENPEMQETVQQF